MPLQTQRLSMTGLSVNGDVPPNNLQPPLADGIHLRWSFERALGFPWYGYYLFRRTTNSADRSLQRFDTGGLAPGPLGSKVLSAAQGQVSSDVTLVTTDDFAPPGAAEFDLASRAYLRFIPADLASQVRIEIGFRQDAEIALTAFLEQTPVASMRVKGKAGQIVAAQLKFDAISSLDIAPGPAAVVSLGFLSATGSPLAGWQAVPGFPAAQAGLPYPLCLPVTHPDYPCPGAPASAGDAQKMAVDRVKYGLPDGWTTTSFSELHGVLGMLVNGGPSGAPMASKQSPVSPVPSDPHLTMSNQSPLDMLLLGALHPGLAQMLGLYWVDESVTASPSTSYDYLIVADYGGLLGGDPVSALQYLRTNGFGSVDAFIVYDKRLNDPSPSLEPPSDVRAFALPGSTMTRPGVSPADANGVGLRWDRAVTSLGTLLPGKPILYHTWRADLGTGTAPATPTSYAHRTTDGPVLVVDPVSGSAAAKPPADWPPVRLHFIDGGLAEGWYGYQVSGVDVFGRHSANSGAAPWYQWKPPPSPLPWYYKPPPDEKVVHPSAVGLLDKISPPPPTSVEASVLDPADPLLVRDAAYAAWRASLPATEKGLVGLRVSWLWPQSHMDQAPDTREFRIYFHAGRQNALLGNTTVITAASATESVVDTDIPNARAIGAYVGARLQIGNASFRIVGSEASSPLRLRVANIGAGNDVRPAAKALCSVVIPETTGSGTTQQPHPLFVDYSEPASWDKRYYVVGYNDHVQEDLIASTQPGGTKLGGSAATVSGTEVALDGSPDLCDAGVVGSYLLLDDDTARADQLYRIMTVDATAGKVALDAAPSLSGTSSGWTVVRRLRRYEVFIPAASDTDRSGSPLQATSTDPLRYGSIGVSAADDKQHTLDAAKWASGPWGGAQRYGNEGRVGPPATIYSVYRGKPPVPELPTYTDERVFATRADYHGRSFFTFRWVPASGTQTHLLRALDDTLFKTDWLLRSTRKALAPTTKIHEPLFPLAWSQSQKQAAAGQLNGINALSGYAGLSAAARELLARLPGNEGFAWGAGLQERDWEIRRTRTSLTASDSTYFPSDWMAVGAANAQKRQDVTTALNAIASPAAYSTLSNNALRVLASLPGNEAAYTQLTIQPLDPSDSAIADRGGPDSPDSYVPSANLRARVDTLDGRSMSRYFYRALNVNAVHTRGDLSLATPPVYFPDVVPPRAPVVTKVLGGERKILLRWSSNRETDLKEYRVYRSDSEEAARDTRLMALIHTEAVSTGDPMLRPAEVTWTDTPVPALLTLYYRLVAVDRADNVSESSPIIAARAFDEALPVAPTPSIAWVVGTPPKVRISWTATEEVLLERRSAMATTWRRVTEWLAPGSYNIDDVVDSTFVWHYRLRARKATGAVVAGGEASLQPL